MSSRVPGAVLIETLAMLSGSPSDRLAKCVYLNVAWLRGADHPRSVGGRDLLPDVRAGAGRRRRIRQEQVALVDALRVAVAAVDQDRVRRRERQLAEAFVARALVFRQLAVQVRPVVPLVLGTVVRAVEVEVIREDRAAGVRDDPAAIRLVARDGAARERRRHARVLQLVAELPGVLRGARLADRIDREAARHGRNRPPARRP